MKKNLRTRVLLAALAASTPALRAAIDISYSDLKQTIDGFGASVAIDSTPYYTDIRDSSTSAFAMTEAQITALSNELFTNSGDNLNVSLLRVSNFFDYKTNYSDTTYTTRPGGTQAGINYVNYLRGTRRVMSDFRSLRSGLPAAEQGSIMMTAWSPPPYLKSNTSSFGGTLRNHPTTGQIDYAGLASWWSRSLGHYAGYSGVVPDMLSIQNEPDFTSSQWEGSRLYAAASSSPVYKDAFAAVRNALLPAYPNLQYQAPDTSALAANADRVKGFLNTLPLAQVDVIAHHLYDPSDTASTANLTALDNAYPFSTYTKYQTEYTGDRSPPDWRYYVDLIHKSLVYERANAYLMWDLIFGCIGDPKNVATKTHCYYALAHYSKYVPVGATRVPALAKNANGSTDTDIYVSAYRKARGWVGNDRLEDQLILVICNMSDTATKTHTIKLSDSTNGSYWDNIVTQRYLKVIRTATGNVRLNWDVNQQGSGSNPLGGDYTITLAPKSLVTVIIN